MDSGLRKKRLQAIDQMMTVGVQDKPLGVSFHNHLLFSTKVRHAMNVEGIMFASVLVVR